MNTNIFKFMLLIFFLTACKKSIDIAKTDTIKPVVTNCDEKIILEEGYYLVSPNAKEIDSMKKSKGENNFFTMADDANNYIAEIDNLLTQPLQNVNASCINFARENFIIKKNDQRDGWFIIDYEKGGKPKIISLVDFFMQLSSNENNKSQAVSDKNTISINTYENNKKYFIKTLDVNKDGIKDKIVSHNRYEGDELIVFLGGRNNDYNLTLRSTNFSEDGGNQISDINETNEGFEIITLFPDKGHLQKKYLVSSVNNSFILKKIETDSYSWQDGYTENCIQNLNIDLKNSVERVYEIIVNTQPKCKKVYDNQSK